MFTVQNRVLNITIHDLEGTAKTVPRVSLRAIVSCVACDISANDSVTSFGGLLFHEGMCVRILHHSSLSHHSAKSPRDQLGYRSGVSIIFHLIFIIRQRSHNWFTGMGYPSVSEPSGRVECAVSFQRMKEPRSNRFSSRIGPRWDETLKQVRKLFSLLFSVNPEPER